MTALGFSVSIRSHRLAVTAYRCDVGADGREVTAEAFVEKGRSGADMDDQLGELAASLETRLKTLNPGAIGIRAIEGSGRGRGSVFHEHGLVEGVILAVGNRDGVPSHLYTLNQVAAALGASPDDVKAEGVEAATARAALRRQLQR